MAGDPRQDPRAHDLLSADPGVVGELASVFRTVALQAHGAGDALRGAQGDANWTGSAADAFRSGVGKLPGELEKVTRSYQEAGDALTAYDGELSTLKPAFQSVVSQLGSADAQLSTAQNNLTSAQAALGNAQVKLTASAMAHPLAPLPTLPVNSPVVAAVGNAQSAVGSAQGNIDALSARGFHILDDFDAARNAAKGKVDSAGQVPPHPSFWDTFFHDVGNFLGGALHFVEGIGAGIWNSVTGTVSAFENFVNHPSLANFGKLASDVAVDAGIVLLAASAPEALGLVGAADVALEGGAAAALDGGTALAADGGTDALAADEPVIEGPFRADSRGPDEIFQNGFQPKGDNMDLWQHVNSNPSDSGYVSTTSSLRSAQDFADETGLDYIYRVRATGIDVNATFGDASPFPWENEIAVPGAIPPEAVQGVWGPDGWVANPAAVGR